MKILVCHTYYMQRGGEDICFEGERDLLRGHGVRVVEYLRHNDEIAAQGRIHSAANAVWNRQAARDVAAIIDRERPDVLHATNTFPLISPAVCHVASRRGVAVVQALQNFRLLCAGAYLMRDGRPCEDCLGRSAPWPALLHGCYRQSAAATAAVVAMQLLHRAIGTWRGAVDAFFAPSEFARQKFLQAGFVAERVHVKPNFVTPIADGNRCDGNYAVFVGRLSPEKGLATVLEAWRSDSALPQLRIVGDGPLADEVQAAVTRDPRITWHGRIAETDVLRIVADALVLLMPSVWYETFGRTTIEAFSVGTPVIGSRLGAMAELIDDGRTGWLFTPGDPVELAARVHAVRRLAPVDLAAIRRNAQAEYERCYTPEQNYARLMQIYDLAIGESERRRRPAIVPASVEGAPA